MKNIYLLLLTAVLWSCAQSRSEEREAAVEPIEVVVHRGANRVAPENTFAAMRKAVEQGADYIEIDLATSSDGIMYCFHDKMLDRTTNGSGMISERASSYLDTLDAGSWFSPDFVGERIPRVKDLIREFRGKAKFYFDVKDADIDELIKLINEEGLEKECFVWFSNKEKAKEFSDKAPEIFVKMNARSPEEILRLIEAYKPEIIECDVAFITPEMQKVCRENNLRLMANLLRDSWWEYEKAMDIRVDMVNIDHPDYFASMLNSPDRQFYEFRLAAHRGGIVEEGLDEFDPRSIQAAIDSGYWMLEIDVRPTADRQLIVHHDHDLARIYGVDKQVSELTLKELKELRALKGKYAPMTFEEVAEMCQGKIRFMVDVKPRDPEPWFCEEINRTLEKYDMLKGAYFIRNDVMPHFKSGKFGFRMEEAAEIKKRMDEGEDVAARYYLFDHGNRINAEIARWCQRNSIDICASVNIGHYKMEDHEAGARRDIAHLKNCGVTMYQIDSPYDEYFNLKALQDNRSL